MTKTSNMQKTKLNSLQAIDKKYHLHPYTNLELHQEKGPMVIKSGKGIYIYDDNGKEYIEALSGLWCLSLGYGNSRLVEAAKKQMESLSYATVFSNRAHEPSVLLAENLIEITPDNITKAFFVNSGSEAIDCAIKFVWYYFNGISKPAKKKLISRIGAYHGTTIASSSVAGLDYVHNGADLPLGDRFFHVGLPSFYHNAKDDETEDEFSTRLAKELEDLILKEGPDTVAAFFAEPVMGAGGVFTPPKGYFDKIQKVLKKYDVLFVADEVINGFYRTGKTWGHQNYNITPDIMVCAKQLSSAYLPIGAVMITDEIYDGLNNVSNKYGMLGTGHTYGGHPVSCAVANEVLAIYKEDRISDHVTEVSKTFQARLQALKEIDIVGDTRGIGMIGAIDLIKDKKSNTKFDPKDQMGLKLCEKGLSSGFITRPTPLPSVGIPLCPPLVSTSDEINKLFDMIEADIKELSSELKS